MPAQHQAMFDPIPPDLDLAALVEKTANFSWVERIKLDDVKSMGQLAFEKLVAIQVIHGGKPLVVEGWNAELQPWLYSAAWLTDNAGKKVELVRDISNEVNHEMTIGHYLKSMGTLTKAMTPSKYRDPRRQRLYLKDIDCPQQWREQLKQVFPKFLFYMNENVAEIGEPGSTTHKNGVGQELQTQGIAPAGDLMSNLPPEMRAENLQLYIGHEGTYTPAHKEMCGTSSQNIMVETSSTLKDGEKDGSAIWFMTEAQDREVVSEYFLSMLGHDIEIEKHFAQVVAWKKAPFPVTVVEQKIGDLVLVPPLAPHQVWNRGNRTIKVAWNRTTVETLEFALKESLPRARMVCRDEQYRVKATVYYSLVKYYARLREADRQDEQYEFSPEAHEKVWDSFRVQMLKDDFVRLAKLFADIMVEEMFSLDLPKVKDIEYLPFEGNVTCSYCRCNIFNRFLTCKTCVEELVNGDEDTYDVCMDCYAMGRSCACISNLSWVEQWRWSELTKKYDEYNDLVRFITQDSDRWILPLADERARRGKKTTAEVCQEQLLRRPWQDIKQKDDPVPGSDIESDPEDAEFKKKMGGKRRKPKAPEVLSKKPCHICKKPDKPWKLAECTNCDAAYCYGSLWRAFDLKPEDIMKDPNWQCPDCLDICSCAQCQRRHPHRAMYEPKGTLLGHDTKAVADPRSVESLVDFSRSNLTWLRDNDTNPKKTRRMQKLIEEAKARKIEYYRYAAEQWGMEPEAFDPESLPGYQTSNKPRASYGSVGVLSGSHGLSVSDLDVNHGGPLPASDDHVAPVAPMGSMAPPPPPSYRDAGYPASINPYQTQNEGSSFQPINGNSEFVAPNDLMNEPRASYPDALTEDMPENHAPPAQQPGDGDEMDESGILFQDPDAPASATDLPQSEYPRLPHETEEDALRLKEGQKKRKRQSMLVDGDMNEAHKEFILTEQRKKLAAARKEGRYYMTQGQLLGGHPYMVTLKVPNKKAELAAIAEIDQGRAGVRHNPREARTSVSHRALNGDGDVDMDLDDEDEDGDIVVPDVRPRKHDEPEPERVARPVHTGNSPEANKKSRRGRPRVRLPSLEPGAVPYEATIKGKSGRGRKSRGADDSEVDVDDDPFEDRYPSPKRKKSTAARTPRASTGRPPGRPRRPTEKAVETMEISDDEYDSDGEIITLRRKNKGRRASAPIDVASPSASPKQSRPEKKSRKSAAAVMQSNDGRTKRTRASMGAEEPEYDHTVLARHNKRSRRSGTSMSQSIIGGNVDGAGSGAEGYGGNYMSVDSHTDDDDIMGPPSYTPKKTNRGGRSSPFDVDMQDDDDAGIDVFADGEEVTIPMADDDAEFERPLSPQKTKQQMYFSDSDSEDTLPAPSPGRQLSSELNEQAQRQQTAEPMPATVESESDDVGGYRMADIPSSSPVAIRQRAPTSPVKASGKGEGYRMADYSDDEVDTAAEEIPTAGPEDDEDDNLNAKFEALRELEEEREREERAKVAAAAKRKAEAEQAKADARREAREAMDREIAEAAQAKAAEKAEMERVVREAQDKANAEQESLRRMSVASDDSALTPGSAADEEEEDGDSDIENTNLPLAAPSNLPPPATQPTDKPEMLSMAQRRALQGKTGGFRVKATKRVVSVEVPGLTLKERRGYAVSDVGVEDEGEVEVESPRVRIKMERRGSGSGGRVSLGRRR